MKQFIITMLLFWGACAAAASIKHTGWTGYGFVALSSGCITWAVGMILDHRAKQP